jgi:hypothetical protein
LGVRQSWVLVCLGVAVAGVKAGRIQRGSFELNWWLYDTLLYFYCTATATATSSLSPHYLTPAIFLSTANSVLPVALQSE